MNMTFLRRHAWALIFTVFVGFSAVLPALIAPFYIGSEYKGIQFTPLDDEDTYRARIHEILDGHFSVASPFMYEYKSSPVPMPPVNEWLYAIPSFLFGLSTIIIVSKFVLPGLLFFLAYLLIRNIIGRDERSTVVTSITGGLFAVLSVDLVDYGYLFSLLQGNPPRPLLWTRLVNPIIGAVEIFAFLNLVWVTVAQRWKYAYIGAGVVLALSVGYYFSFGISAALLGVLFCVYVYRREFGIARELAATGALALLLSTPYWYTVVGVVGGSRELAMRNGMFFTHMPVFNKALITATLIVLVAYTYAYIRGTARAFAREWIFVGALIGAGWIVFNEQVFTGREIWHHHFVQYTVPLSAIAIVLAMHLTIRERLPRLFQAGILALFILCAGYGLYSIASFASRTDDFAQSQVYAPVGEWLNANAPKDCVVLVKEDSDQFERFIAAYTGCNVYSSDVAYSGVPMERIEHNFFLHMRFSDVKLGDAETYLWANEGFVRGTFYEDWNQALMSADPEFSARKIAYLVPAYQEFAGGNLEEQIRKYRVDYVVSEEPIPEGLMGQLPNLVQESEVGQYHVYRFRP